MPGRSFDFDYTQYKEIALYLRETNGDHRIYIKTIYTMDDFLSSNSGGYHILYIFYSGSANVFGAVRLVSLTEGKIYMGVNNTSSTEIEVHAR